jgi:hypothetical protein
MVHIRGMLELSDPVTEIEIPLSNDYKELKIERKIMTFTMKNTIVCR